MDAIWKQLSICERQEGPVGKKSATIQNQDLEYFFVK